VALLKRRTAEVTALPAEVEAPATTDVLIVSLRSGATPIERRLAALDLATAHEAAPALAAALDGETDWGVQEAIITALTSIGTDQAAKGLADVVVSENAALRNAASEALRQIGAPARCQVERLMGFTDPDARIFAIGILEASHDDAARTLLHTALQHEPEINVGLAAVEVLSHMGGPEDVLALRAFAARFPGEPFVAFAVNVACGQIPAVLSNE
jgi:HEAT repeat protein